MVSKTIYSAVAVLGIAVAASSAYWYHHKPTSSKEITAAGPGAGGATPAGGAAAGGPSRAGAMPAVEVAKVEATRLQDDAQAVGSLRSRQNVMLRPEVSGRLKSLGFTDGGRVRRGDVMVQLEDTLQRAEVRQAQAQMSISQANFKRNQELVAQNFVAQRVLDESSASLQVAEAQVALACARWERMRVVAPFDGTVGIRNVNVGDYVKDGADLVNLEDLSSMLVDFRLPERFVGKLRRDQQIELQLDAMPGRLFKAKIDAIDPQLDANGRSVLVRAVLPNTPGEPMAQRPGGPGGPGGPAGAGAPGAAGPLAARPLAPGAAAKPAAPAARPAQRGASAPNPSAAAEPRAADAVAASCAAFSSTASARAASTPNVAGASASRGAGAGSGARPPAGAGGPGAGAAPGGGPLRPGMFARVTAVFNVKDSALTVPEEAIVPQGGRQFVIRLIEQTEAQAKEIADKQAADAAKAAEAGKAAASAPGTAASGAPAAGGAGAGAGPGGAQPYPMGGFVDGKRLVSQRVEVKLGIRRPGRVEITEGLQETDTVVVAGQQRLQRDNTPVRVIELGRPPGAGGPPAAGGAAPAAAAASTPAAAASR